MKMKIITFLLFVASCSFAATLTIPNGECMNFTLYNTTANSTYTEEHCSGNATVVQNTTNVTNYGCFNLSVVLNASDALHNSYNNSSCNLTFTAVGNTTTTINNTVYENVSVLYCPPTNTTLTGNGTTTINNQTFISVCNAPSGACSFNGTMVPSASEQTWENVSGLHITLQAIPSSYCYENRYEVATSSNVFRSDKCNSTFVCNVAATGCPSGTFCQLPQQACPVCQSCAVCPEAVACPAINTTNCDEVRANLTASCGAQLASQASISQSQLLPLMTDRDNALSQLNTSRKDANDWKDAAKAAQDGWNNDKNMIGLIFLGVCVIGAVKIIYDVTHENRLTRDINSPSVMSSEEKASRAKAGSELGAFDRKKKMVV